MIDCIDWRENNFTPFVKWAKQFQVQSSKKKFGFKIGIRSILCYVNGSHGEFVGVIFVQVRKFCFAFMQQATHSGLETYSRIPRRITQNENNVSHNNYGNQNG